VAHYDELRESKSRPEGRLFDSRLTNQRLVLVAGTGFNGRMLELECGAVVAMTDNFIILVRFVPRHSRSGVTNFWATKASPLLVKSNFESASKICANFACIIRKLACLRDHGKTKYGP
jgi:hypothetical protein